MVVVPIANEAELYYYDWVEGNIKKVSDATDGKVGYLHVPDMQTTGLNEFAKHFYPQVRKKALIIDVRGNGGGNVSPMLIERLTRRDRHDHASPATASPTTSPPAMIYGPMVCLMNEFSASDGDLFPYRFRQHKLGKLIGKRSWGGVVGIRGSLPLLDGGTLKRPEFSRYDLDGKKWIIEGHGVDPDIVVDNDPAKEYAGDDEQLNKAISVIQEELKTQEKDDPAAAAVSEEVRVSPQRHKEHKGITKRNAVGICLPLCFLCPFCVFVVKSFNDPSRTKIRTARPALRRRGSRRGQRPAPGPPTASPRRLGLRRRPDDTLPPTPRPPPA